MSPTVINFMTATVLAAVLGGCGLTQRVADNTTATAKAIFYKQVTTLHLDFSGRVALNTDRLDMNGLSVPTLVRIYQLRDRKALVQATYDELLAQSDSTLGADLLAQRAIVVKPGGGAQVSIPMEPGAQFVAVAAFFRTPDTELGSWRVVLARNELDPDQPRVIELGGNRLSVRPRGKE